ncbi:SDR family oxidoreductase [Tistrella sp. BH-R2-4]|uniref:SDR family oxidoreductase n=1 Tax=Tistrella arctica TaxID=3133430 RepID=A0ABU9YNM7_9PROT
MFTADLLKGRRALVTGGGTGLGLAIAGRYAELGADLVLVGRRADVLDDAAASLAARHGVTVDAISCDVRDAIAVDAMMDRAFATRPIDILVNNAAGNFLARSETLSPRAVDAIIDIVLKGSANVTLAAGRRWVSAGLPAAVLCILTQSALTGAPYKLPSAMAKAGVLAMIRSLAVEWGPHGIRLNGIAPGPFPTEGAFGRLRPAGTEMPPPEAGVALGRTGKPAELADLAAFLVSDGAGYITGEVLAIDGGRRLEGAAGPDLAALRGWTPAVWDSLRGVGRSASASTDEAKPAIKDRS